MAALGSANAPAQSLPPGGSIPPAALLDVPYLPQSELLCGGAALAMVERWWGKRGVNAEDYASLVRRELGGIRAGDLALAAQSGGWATTVFNGTPDRIQRALRERVPVVALIEVAPRRYHFVVIVGWNAGTVVYHDPAVAPGAAVEEARFLSAWAGADRWAMIIRPSPAPPVGVVPAPAVPAADPLPCAPWLDQAVDSAASGRIEVAEQNLQVARARCPAEPVILRELAGVRFKQKRYAEAEVLARGYLDRVPGDSLGWQLLGASRYLSGDADGALAAWNRIGRPAVDLVRVEGSRNIRYRVLFDAVGIPPGPVLTPGRLTRARRRVQDIPALARARVEYTPVQGGIVEVRAAVAERPRLERPIQLLAAGGVRALAQREARLDIAALLGAGELWSGVWRWQPARRLVGGRLDIPARLGLRGVFSVAGAWNRYRFGLDSAVTHRVQEERRSAEVGFGGWITGAIHPSAGLRLERWSGGRDYLTGTLGGSLRLAGDRLTIGATGAWGGALSPTASYTRAGAEASWISAPGFGRAVWSARVGAERSSVATPLGAWASVGADLTWAIPLRAHFSDSGSTLSGAGTGRTILHGGLSGDLPVVRLGPIVFAAGAFLDGAQVRAPADGSGENHFYLDAGTGLRIGIADGHLGVLRIDWAHGLVDRASALTVGVHQSWPVIRM